ncbi:MAG TPA: RuBisCO large subunit C-terminal-like domain-containing protein [Gemmatimonadales bacterium]|nr:RuBisCO large subunit C-terminal-like domain-containing protein [Gemmatimonadales bacterium]
MRSAAQARAMAESIALEQTVEIPGKAVPHRLKDVVVGRVGPVRRHGEGAWQVTIRYEPRVVGGEVPQFLNLLFGNVSLFTGVLIQDLALPPAVLRTFPGPRFGIAGLRRICGVTRRRPLLSASAKPVGLTPRELGEICGKFARGGVDIVKDDHSLSDQGWAPFRERVARCQEAVERANTTAGTTAVFFPNLTAPVDQLEERAAYAREVGCRGVLVSPMLLGLDAVRVLAQRSGLALLAHPMFAGAFFGARHGISPNVLLGTIYRLIGADGVIYPNAGGRFPTWTEPACAELNRRLRSTLGPHRPSLPVAGGGVDAERVRHWHRRYGPDMMYLIGSSFYVQRDLEGAARRVAEVLRLTP